MTRDEASAFLNVIMMNRNIAIQRADIYVGKTITRMSPCLFRELAKHTGVFELDGFSQARVYGTEVSIDMRLQGLSYELFLSYGIGILDGITEDAGE